MSEINLSEVNGYIANLYDTVGLRDLQAAHAERIRQWFVGNMSNVGRYSHRDFERFGTLSAVPGDNNVAQRQDGWQAVTEETVDIDHINFGTGIVYIHGELSIPQYEDGAGNAIVGDEYRGASLDAAFDDATGQHFQVEATGNNKDGFTVLQNGSDPVQGYKWEWDMQPVTGDGAESGFWWYDTILETVAKPTETSSYSTLNDTYNVEPTATATSPTEINDGEMYGLDNERNNFPWIIVNSGQPLSIDTLLQSLNGTNGMFDGNLPLVTEDAGTYPPIQGLQITEAVRTAILDFISPLNETPRA